MEGFRRSVEIAIWRGYSYRRGLISWVFRPLFAASEMISTRRSRQSIRGSSEYARLFWMVWAHGWEASWPRVATTEIAIYIESCGQMQGRSMMHLHEASQIVRASDRTQFCQYGSETSTWDRRSFRLFGRYRVYLDRGELARGAEEVV